MQRASPLGCSTHATLVLPPHRVAPSPASCKNRTGLESIKVRGQSTQNHNGTGTKRQTHENRISAAWHANHISAGTNSRWNINAGTTNDNERRLSGIPWLPRPPFSAGRQHSSRMGLCTADARSWGNTCHQHSGGMLEPHGLQQGQPRFQERTLSNHRNSSCPSSGSCRRRRASFSPQSPACSSSRSGTTPPSPPSAHLTSRPAN